MISSKQLFSMDCLHCVLDRVLDTTLVTGTPEPRRREIMHKALRLLADGDLNRPGFLQIEQIYRMVLEEIGVDDPYIDIKREYDIELAKRLPKLRECVAASDDKLGAAVRFAIAGNQIDLAAHGVDASMDSVEARLIELEKRGLDVDNTAGLAAALRGAKTVLMLGDNCGEIAMDRLLAETILELYPQVKITYAVRGLPAVNDALREDAHIVGMDEIAEIIDTGSGILAISLDHMSESFVRAFESADVVISKGMGNYEGLFDCERGNVWFLLIAKCRAVAQLSGTAVGNILCMEHAGNDSRNAAADRS